MRISFASFFVLALAVLTACQTGAPGPKEAVRNNTGPEDSVITSGTPRVDPTATDQSDDAPRISLEKAKEAWDRGDTLFIDTRSENAYVTEHIKGAVNIPLEFFEQRFKKEVPKGKPVIAYCS